jgi:hypothetical protein
MAELSNSPSPDPAMTTTEANITITEQTVSAADNLFQLDALIQGYGEILEQAKQQLEAFEPTEDQFRLISRNLATNLSYRELGKTVAAAIVDENADHETRRYTEELVHRISGQIDERKIRVLIRDELSGVVDTCFQELKRHVENQIERLLDEDRRAASRANYELQSAMRTIFSTVLKDELRDQVRREMNDVYQAREAAANS